MTSQPLSAPDAASLATLLPANRLLSLAESIAATAAAPITPAALQTLRRQHSPEAAAMLVAIAAEQRRASEKLGPGTWMVSAKAIRQATDQVVAEYKASLLAERPVFDLCGGIGGDAIALARRGAVATVDCDPQVTAMAAANLHLARSRQSGGGGQTAAAQRTPGEAIAICADVTRYRIPCGVAIHIDPDRRPGQRRTSRPSDYLPSLQFVQELLVGRTAGIVKLAPAAMLEEESGGADLARRHHRQWISLDASVREQTLLCGDAIAAAGVAAGGRSAVRLMRDGTLQRFAIDAPTAEQLDELNRSLPVSAVPPGWIIDLDPAVRGGGLSAALAVARGLTALGGPAGFFGTDVVPQERSLMQCFETLWSGPADRKQIKRELRRGGWSLQSVKVRGTDHDPAELQRTLRPEKAGVSRLPKARSAPGPAAADHEPAGPVAVTLLIGRCAQGVYAVIGRKLPQ